MATTRIPNIDEAGNFTNPDVLDRLRETVGGADPLQWQTSRAFDIGQAPRRDDFPVITWAAGTATQLTSPVEYKPSILGTGSKVTGWNGQNDPVFQFFPGSYASGWGANNDMAMEGDLKPGNPSHNSRWPIVFSVNTSATDTLELAFMGPVSAISFLFEINGRLVDDTAMRPPTTITGASASVSLKFPTARARHIRVWIGSSPSFMAARVPTGASLSKPTTTGRTAVIIGDSFVNGAGPSDAYPNQGAGMFETFAPRILRMLGFDRMMLAGLGGTGWTTANPFSTRVSAALAVNPDLIVFYGSVNDGANNTALDQAVTDTLALIPANVPVLVIPPHLQAYEGSYARVRSAALAAGRTVVEPGYVITGTGRVGAPKGDGNRDYYVQSDNVHPTLDGHRALARAIFETITK